MHAELLRRWRRGGNRDHRISRISLRSRSRRSASRPPSARGCSTTQETPPDLNSSRHNLAISSGSRPTRLCCGQLAVTGPPRSPATGLAASSATASSTRADAFARRQHHFALDVSSVPDTECETTLPERNGRWAAVRGCPAPSASLAAAAAAACTIATSVARHLRAVRRRRSARRAAQHSRECPATAAPAPPANGSERSSKQTIRLRPSASTERGMRTKVPEVTLALSRGCHCWPGGPPAASPALRPL